MILTHSDRTLPHRLIPSQRPGMEGSVDAKRTAAPLGLARTSLVSDAEDAFEIFIISIKRL
jgi:hypothetical protein